jgi:neocarzinostatin family protein
MKGIRRYVLPVVAGASMVLALSAVTPMVASAKGKTCTVPTGCGKIKASPKTVVASATASTITVKGSGFTPNDTSVNLIECQTAAVAEASCDLATVTPVTVSSKGTFTQTFNFVTNTYTDTNKDKCTNTSKKPIKTCGVAAGNQTMTDDASIVAVAIKG